MSEVDIALQKLIETIRESAEYRSYQQAKTKLKENAELEQRVNLLRRQNYQLQTDNHADQFERADQLWDENRELMNDPIVSGFLASELAFCRVVQNINWSIIEGLDFDIEFMNK